MNDTTTPIQQDRAKHYHLFALMVIYEEGGREKRKFLNSVSPSDEPFVSTMDIARIQHQTQVRFQQAFDPNKKFKLLDVYIQSVSYLGYMTMDQFDGGFSKLAGAPTKAEQEFEPDQSTPAEDEA